MEPATNSYEGELVQGAMLQGQLTVGARHARIALLAQFGTEADLFRILFLIRAFNDHDTLAGDRAASSPRFVPRHALTSLG